MSKNLLLVEFVGLPGAGKTTLANKTVKRLQGLNYDVYSREIFLQYRKNLKPWKRRLSYFNFCARNLWSLIHVIQYVVLIKPLKLETLDFGYQFFRIAYHMNEAVQDATQKGYEMIVFDQGVLQAMWSIGISGKPRISARLKKRLSRLHRHIFVNKNMFIPLLRVQIETAYKRIRQRSTFESRFDMMSQDSAMSKLVENEKFLYLIVDTVREQRRVKVLNISNNQETSSAGVDYLVPSIVDTYKNLKAPQTIQ